MHQEALRYRKPSSDPRKKKSDIGKSVPYSMVGAGTGVLLICPLLFKMHRRSNLITHPEGMQIGKGGDVNVRVGDSLCQAFSFPCRIDWGYRLVSDTTFFVLAPTETPLT